MLHNLRTVLSLPLLITATISLAQVGVGTIDPATNLHVVDSAGQAEIKLSSTTNSSVLTLDAAGSPKIHMNNAGETKATLTWLSNQLKIYSSDPDTQYIAGNPVLFPMPTLNLSESRNVGIQMGLLGTPQEALHVNGRIKLGNSSAAATAGTMRYNDMSKQFEGYNGGDWKPFTGSLYDDDGDTFISFGEDVIDSIKFTANSLFGGTMAFDGHRLTLGKDGNTIVGHEATPIDISTNIGNTMVGWLNGYNMLSGVSNTSLGFWTGHSLVGGDYNTLLGAYAGYSVKDGLSNTMIGYRAGYKNSGERNVFLGHQAGYNEFGDDKLYIDNTDTSDPLIYGDFDDDYVKMNADAEITQTLTVNGNSYLQNNVDIDGVLNTTGNANIGGNVTSEDVIISDANPFVDFRQLGVSKYSLQYNAPNDRFDIQETGTGSIVRIKDGEIYFPELAGSEAMLKVDASGKLSLVEEVPMTCFANNLELKQVSGGNYIVPITDRLEDGAVLSSLTIRGYQSSSIVELPLTVRLWRVNTLDLDAFDLIFNLEILGEDLSETAIQEYTTSTIETAGTELIDLDGYMYYLLVLDEGANNFVSAKLSE